MLHAMSQEQVRHLLGEPYVTVPELARVLGVHRGTVSRWLTRGLLPAFRLGGTTRIPAAAAREFLENRTGVVRHSLRSGAAPEFVAESHKTREPRPARRGPRWRPPSP